MTEPRTVKTVDGRTIIGPINSLSVPRFAGFSTFARLPRVQDITTSNVSSRIDIAIIGIPFDSGTTYRPGARFGPSAIREASRILRPYNPLLNVLPFSDQQVVDAGDIGCNPFNIPEAVVTIQKQIEKFIASHPGVRLVVLGGDHTISLPLLRAVKTSHGVRPALVHFDAHLDTWDTYFGEPCTHGTPFRRASEENLFDPDHSIHVGIRGPVYDPNDFTEDTEMGFKIVHAMDIQKKGWEDAARRIRDRIGNKPIYISIDIDVLDPAHAPGTGTPEVGGLTSRELQAILQSFRGLNIIGADVVEVSPAYDHAQLTSLAASAMAYEIISLMCPKRKSHL